MIYLVSTTQILNHLPHLFINYDPSLNIEFDDDDEDLEIKPDIEEKTKLRINIFEDEKVD